ncbi:T9SS type A sorting domain-containing protein [Sanyastnella coralliicola]|uniref:T9SS type A sorting domain-containing protein n=1 Tax=Sanyastnella coralliicola TaxID=3069118 RepID=UPI0027BA6BEF|nr:T9SS type A sorting domain-containing protein [Longitalea sp. SCSIO 12813]
MLKWSSVFLVFAICHGTFGWGQLCDELVPNGGFEDFTQLPDDDCDWNLAVGWTNASNGSQCNSSNGTPDYFHQSGTDPFSSLPSNYFAALNPSSGNAVMGLAGYISFINNAREYIAIELECPLVVGEMYQVSIDITKGISNVDAVAHDGFGILLSQNQVLQADGCNCLINASPQFIVPDVIDFDTWQTYTFDFIADQPYEYLTFGNFSADNQLNFVDIGNPGNFSLSYVFVDNVSLFPLNMLLDVSWGPSSISEKEHGLNVQWTTLNELNSSHFIVETSQDMLAWKYEGTEHSNGNSSIQRVYDFALSLPLSPTYVRISEVNTDGIVDRGPILFWEPKLGAKTQFSISNQSLLITSTRPVDISLFRIDGKLEYRNTISGQFQFDLNQLQPGLYFVTDGIEAFRFAVFR